MRKGTLALNFAVLALALVTCRPRQQPLPPLKDLNIILIVIDTLSAKHVGAYGAKEAHTPAIDGMAKNGVRFSRAYAAAPWTKPSISTILTGRLPKTHGVRRLNSKMSEKVQTAAELFSAAGRQTGGIVSHVVMAPKYGYARGFESYENVNKRRPHKTITGAKVTDGAIAWLQQRKNERRFFLFLHYFDPHYDYNHHPQFDRTSRLGYRGRLRSGMDIREVRADIKGLTPADVNYVRGHYAEEAAYTDQQIGRLLSHLQQAGLAENTLIVLAADHGEEFMERDWIGHTRTLYDELIRVPLIFICLAASARPSSKPRCRRLIFFLRCSVLDRSRGGGKRTGGR